MDTGTVQNHEIRGVTGKSSLIACQIQGGTGNNSLKPCAPVAGRENLPRLRRKLLCWRGGKCEIVPYHLLHDLWSAHWSRYELHNRTSIHSEKLIITISPPRSNNTANSLAKSINSIMKALITRRPGYELSYESHNEANSGLIARDQSEISR